jgi:hypothetical protein
MFIAFSLESSFIIAILSQLPLPPSPAPQGLVRIVIHAIPGMSFREHLQGSHAGYKGVVLGYLRDTDI